MGAVRSVTQGSPPRKRPKAEVSRALAPHLAALHAKYGGQAKTDRAAS